MKKPGLDITSYRPLSNLSVLTSKLNERLVAHLLIRRDYLTSTDLPPPQSGFRPDHSTETAVLRILSGILQAVDHRNVVALVILDLSATFESVDREILFQRLCVTFGIHDTVHQWFKSYLLAWSHTVCAAWAYQLVKRPSDVWWASKVSGGPTIN